jgi:hypothetical protein
MICRIAGHFLRHRSFNPPSSSRMVASGRHAYPAGSGKLTKTGSRRDRPGRVNRPEKECASKHQASEDPVLGKRTIRSQREQIRGRPPLDAEGTACQLGAVPGGAFSARQADVGRAE